ncbi:dual specificity phosphatase [Ostreococcus tauri]|uniref:Dual specificity phosphatase n=2 Tax=Ostreococcus tauri TaxID=70448 RepID=A0A1Y5IEA2_OSTTA|nr:dual specificity phosphatase [Ostreococcus tauri]
MIAQSARWSATARAFDGRRRARWSSSHGRGCARRCGATANVDQDAMKDEQSGYKKRAEESKEAGVKEKRPPRGGQAPAPGSWSWTLNWDYITIDPQTNELIEEPSAKDCARARMLIGSCPRTAEDVDRLVDEAGVEAIVCLQCAMCHSAMEIDWQAVRRRALEREVMIVQVSVRDFDRLDQAKMLPEAVRKLAAFQAMGKRTYVHCTAGINRASLTVVGYLTFVKQFNLEDALRVVRTCRPQANPYVVSWQIARARLLANRVEDTYLYTQVTAGGNSSKEGGDWIQRDLERAEKGVIAEIFKRAIDTDLSMYGALLDFPRKK